MPNGVEKYSAVRAPGREHIPIFPKGFIAIRIVQLVLSVIILGLSGYGVAVLPSGGIIFIFVVALMTLITSIYEIVAETGAPHIYNYWAILALDVMLVVLWLCTFAMLGSAVAFMAAFTEGYYIGYTYYTDYYYSRALVGALAGAAAIGAGEFIVHLISLVIGSVMLHRHRKAGLHSAPGAARTVPGQGPPGAPISAPIMVASSGAGVHSGEKTQELYTQQQAYPVQQQQPPPVYPTQQTMTPPPSNPYPPPQQQQQQGGYYAPQPLVSQHTGGSYVQQSPPVQHQPMPQHPQQAYQAVPYQAAPTQ